MEIAKITYTEESFRTLPASERRLVFQIANLINELRFFDHHLFVLVDVMKNRGPLSDPEIGLAISQNCMLFCLLAGKLKEAWQVVQKGYFATSLSKQFHSKLPMEGSDALKTLKDYFSRPNLVETLRNNYGFHHDLDKIGDIIDHFPLDWKHVAYLPDVLNNGFFEFGQVCLMNAILKSTGETDPRNALLKLWRELHVGLLNDFVVFFHSVLQASLAPLPATEETVEVANCPNLRDAKPLFLVLRTS